MRSCPRILIFCMDFFFRLYNLSMHWYKFVKNSHGLTIKITPRRVRQSVGTDSSKHQLFRSCPRLLNIHTSLFSNYYNCSVCLWNGFRFRYALLTESTHRRVKKGVLLMLGLVVNTLTQASLTV